MAQCGWTMEECMYVGAAAGFVPFIGSIEAKKVISDTDSS